MTDRRVIRTWILLTASLSAVACSGPPSTRDANVSNDGGTMGSDGSADASRTDGALPDVGADDSAPPDAAMADALPLQPCRLPSNVGAIAEPTINIPMGILRTIYLSTAQGDDSRSLTQAGSMSTPWRTLARVQQAFTSGEITTRGTALLLDRGETFYGRLDLSLPQAQRFGTTPALFVGAYGSGAMPTWINATLLSEPISHDATSATFPAPALPTAGTNGGTLFDWRVFVNGSELPLARIPSCAGVDYPSCNGPSHRIAIVSAADATATVAGHSTTVTKVTLPAGSVTLPVPGPAYLALMAYSWIRYHGQIVGSETDSAGRPVLWVQLFENTPGGAVRASPMTVGATLPAGWGAFIEGPALPSTTPGEWNVTSAGLVVRAPSGVDLTTARVELGTTTGALVIEGFDGVTVQGIHFLQGVGAQVFLNESLGGGGGAGPQNISVIDNVFDRPQYTGLALFGGALSGAQTNHIEVARNTVTDGWNNGFSMHALYNASIHHNRFERIGLGQYASSSHAIDGENLIQSTIEYNYLHQIGYIGIGGDGFGSTQIQFNVIDQTNVTFGDGGGIYYNFDRGGVTVHRNAICNQMLPVNADFGPNATISAQGIYLDDNTSPGLIEENTLVDIQSSGIFAVSHSFVFPSDGAPTFFRDDGDGNASVVQDWHVIRGNVIVNAHDGLQYLHGTEGSPQRSCGTAISACPTRGVLQSLTNNLFYTTTLTQTPIALSTLDATMHDFGSFSTNLIAHRAGQATYSLFVNDTVWRNNVPPLFTLTGWEMLGPSTISSRCADCRETAPDPWASGSDAQCANAVVAESRGPFAIQASSGNVTQTALSASEATADGFPASATGVHRIVLPAFTSTRPNEWASAGPGIGAVSAGQTYRFRFTARAVADAATFGTASVQIAPGGYYGMKAVPLDTSVREYEIVVALDSAIVASISDGSGLTVLTNGDVEISAIQVDRVTCGMSTGPLVLTNLSTTPTTYPLPAGSWRRPDGTPLSGTVTVDAYYSAVLDQAP